MTKKAKLEKLAKKIRTCRRCRLWKSRALAVPGEGDSGAEIMLLGESPGDKEDEAGRPFVGPSGKFLDWLLKKNNIDRKEIFISSVIKCHPPKNRNPKLDELKTCGGWWRTQIDIIKPKVVVLLGGVALKAVLGCSDLSGCHDQKIVKNDLIYFSTFHPSAGRRFPQVKKKMIKDFKSVKRLVS